VQLFCVCYEGIYFDVDNRKCFDGQSFENSPFIYFKDYSFECVLIVVCQSVL